MSVGTTEQHRLTITTTGSTVSKLPGPHPHLRPPWAAPAPVTLRLKRWCMTSQRMTSLTGKKLPPTKRLRDYFRGPEFTDPSSSSDLPASEETNWRGGWLPWTRTDTERQYRVSHNYFAQSVWPDLAKFCHFGKSLQIFGKFLTDYFLFGKCWAYFGKFVTLLGQFSLL